MARRQRRHWARAPEQEKGVEPSESGFIPSFQPFYLQAEEEDYYKDKLRDMEVSSELVWFEEQDFVQKGRKELNAKKDEEIATFDDLSKLEISSQQTSATPDRDAEERDREACTSTFSSHSESQVGVKETATAKLKEKLKKNLLKLKRRGRSVKSATIRKPVEIVEALGEGRSSKGQASKTEKDECEEGEEYSDSFESFVSEDEFETRDNMSLLGSDSDICCYDSGTSEGFAEELCSDKGAARSPERCNRADEEDIPLSTSIEKLDDDDERYLLSVEMASKSIEELSYDDLIDEYISGFDSDLSNAAEENVMLGSPTLHGATLLSEAKPTPPPVEAVLRKPLDSLDSNAPEPAKEEKLKSVQHVSNRKEERNLASKSQTIPETPSGLTLTLVILSNWGDKDYVGLNGVEIFDKEGHIVGFCNPQSQLTLDFGAEEDTVESMLPLERLINGTNLTCDESHIWLVPFNSKARPQISFAFREETSIGAVRIWNYNKSRIHSHRGAREVQLLLDETCIFHGDVQKAPGIASDAWEGAESILFTTNEQTFKNIEAFDSKYASVLSTPQIEIERLRQSMLLPPIEMIELEEQDTCLLGTGAEDIYDSIIKEIPAVSSCEESNSISVQELSIEILSTWGDAFYVGLSGIEILDENNLPLDLTMDHLDAVPLDLNVLPDSCSDDRTLDKLISGENVTTDDINMWLAPVGWEDRNNSITVNFGVSRRVSGIRIWNYNKSLEDTHRGVKTIKVFADGRLISPTCGWLIPKAPGVSTFDYSYLIEFHKQPPAVLKDNNATAGSSDLELWSHALSAEVMEKVLKGRSINKSTQMIDQGWKVSFLPCGFVLKLELFSTWGDPHYIGLAGIELVDAISGNVIVPASSVSAKPRGVCDLEDMEKDLRVPGRLIDGHNRADEISHSWLAPYCETNPNLVCIYLNRPIVLAAVRVWNYAKTPSRGAKDFHLYLDDNLIFGGVLRKYEDGLGDDFHQSFLFTQDEGLVREEREYVSEPSAIDPLEVIFTNNNQVVKGKVDKAVSFGPRPQTSVVGI